MNQNIKIAKKLIYLAKSLVLQKIKNAELTEYQKKRVDWYTKQRYSDLSFGDIFKSQRTYFSIGSSILSVIQIPKEIERIIDKQGYYCPDYRKGYVYKKDDKLKNKPVKLVKILSKGESNKQKFNQLKKQFDQRIGTSRKQNKKCKICITYNPYDVAGMSTDRNWTSCMNLDTGAYSDTPLKQVQFGGMCAYLIQQDDRDIKKPIARIAIKRFVGQKGGFLFLAENTIYGDVDFADELNFMENVINILNKSNQNTMKDSKVFFRDDEGSYSDSDIKMITKFKDNKEFLEYVKKDPQIINEQGFLQSLDIMRVYLLFDYLIEYKKYKAILRLFFENWLNNEQIEKFVNSLIQNKNYITMEQFLCGNKKYVKIRKRIIESIIKLGGCEQFLYLIRLGHILKDELTLIINSCINENVSTFVLKKFLMECNQRLDNEHKNKIIKKLIEKKEYRDLIWLINMHYIQAQNINTIVESIFDNYESIKNDFDLSEIIINGNPFLKREYRQKIMQMILSENDTFQIYNLLDEKKLNAQQQLEFAKKMLNKEYYVQAYEHIIHLVHYNKFDQSVKDKVLDMIDQDATERYNNGQINQIYLNEIKDQLNSLR